MRWVKDLDQLVSTVARESSGAWGMGCGSEPAARRKMVRKVLMRKSVAPSIEVKGEGGMASISNLSWCR